MHGCGSDGNDARSPAKHKGRERGRLLAARCRRPSCRRRRRWLCRCRLRLAAAAWLLLLAAAHRDACGEYIRRPAGAARASGGLTGGRTSTAPAGGRRWRLLLLAPHLVVVAALLAGSGSREGACVLPARLKRAVDCSKRAVLEYKARSVCLWRAEAVPARPGCRRRRQRAALAPTLAAKPRDAGPATPSASILDLGWPRIMAKQVPNSPAAETRAFAGPWLRFAGGTGPGEEDSWRASVLVATRATAGSPAAAAPASPLPPPPAGADGVSAAAAAGGPAGTGPEPTLVVHDSSGGGGGSAAPEARSQPVLLDSCEGWSVWRFDLALRLTDWQRPIQYRVESGAALGQLGSRGWGLWRCGHWHATTALVTACAIMPVRLPCARTCRCSCLREELLPCPQFDRS